MNYQSVYMGDTLANLSEAKLFKAADMSWW